VVKLVFGTGYDKTRLTEFAAALSWARRHDLATGNLAAALEGFQGGLKAVVAAERAERRPAAKPDRSAAQRELLQAAAPLALVDEDLLGERFEAGELVLLVGRSDGHGRLEIVAPALRDGKLIAGAIAKAAA
jgi:hypothetical protein